MGGTSLGGDGAGPGRDGCLPVAVPDDGPLLGDEFGNEVGAVGQDGDVGDELAAELVVLDVREVQ